MTDELYNDKVNEDDGSNDIDQRLEIASVNASENENLLAEARDEIYRAWRDIERLQNSLQGIQQFAEEQSDRMDRLAVDPDNNGEGSVPTGDDWNALFAIIQKVTSKS